MASQYIRIPAQQVTFPAGTTILVTTINGRNLVGAQDVFQTDFQDTSTQNITSSYSALGAGAALTADCYSININCTFGAPIDIGVGASSGTAVRKFLINQGAQTNLNLIIPSGSKLWVKTLDGSTVSAGFITVNYMG